MALYIVRNNLLGTTAVVDADGAETAARSHAHGASELATPRAIVAVQLPAGAVALYVQIDESTRAERPMVTARPVSSSRDTRADVESLRGTATLLYVDVYTRGADGRPIYQGTRGWTADGDLTATYYGDRELILARIRLDASESVFVAPTDEVPAELRDTRPRLPRDRKRSQTFATGATATDSHGSYSVSIPSSDGTPGSSHPSRIRSRALTFARSIWGGSAYVTNRLSPQMMRDADGAHVPGWSYAVAIVDPIDAYRFAAGNELYGELS